MSYTLIDERQVKELFKQALSEVFQEREEWFYGLFAEVIEDYALVRAVKGGGGWRDCGPGGDIQHPR